MKTDDKKIQMIISRLRDRLLRLRVLRVNVINAPAVNMKIPMMNGIRNIRGMGLNEAPVKGSIVGKVRTDAWAFATTIGAMNKYNHNSHF